VQHTVPAGRSRALLLCHVHADTYKKNDVLSIQENIVSHIEYTMARSRYRFDDFECYQATALSLRDRLVEQWNDTQTHFKWVLDASAHAHTRTRSCSQAHAHTFTSTTCMHKRKRAGGALSQAGDG